MKKRLITVVTIGIILSVISTNEDLPNYEENARIHPNRIISCDRDAVSPGFSWSECLQRDESEWPDGNDSGIPER